MFLAAVLFPRKGAVVELQLKDFILFYFTRFMSVRTTANKLFTV